MDRQPRNRNDGARSPLSLYLHEPSRDRLKILVQVLNTNCTAVIAHAVSRWVVAAVSNRDSVWSWYVETPFEEAPAKKTNTVRVSVRLPTHAVKQIQGLAETLHVSLSAVVEQALLRWCREEPLMEQSSRTNGTSTTATQEV